MTLLFDLMSAQPVGATRYHGGGEYIKAVLVELLTKYPNLDICVAYDGDSFIDDWVASVLDRSEVGTVNVKAHDGFYQLLNSGKFESFYSGLPYWFDRSRVHEKVFSMGTVHGLRMLECPVDARMGYGQRGTARVKSEIKRHFPNTVGKRAQAFYERCLNSLDLVVTDSDFSKYSILVHYPQTSRVEVLYCPQTKVSAGQKAIEELEGEEFVLLVSCNRWEKNASRAADALDGLFQMGYLDGYKVACTGISSLSYLGKLQNANRFVPLGYVDPVCLNWLYENCALLLYPTLNEGFGYPPIEAMRYGKTCVVSCVCSLPEICGNAVYYVNPYDISEMRARVLQAACEPVGSDIVAGRYERITGRQIADKHRLLDLIALAGTEPQQLSKEFCDAKVRCSSD